MLTSSTEAPINSSRLIAILELCGSLKLTLVLLAVLLLLTVLGAWIPQASVTDEAIYLEKFGTDGSVLLKSLGLTNAFQSPTFLFSIALLFLNLAACTAVNMGPRIRKKFAGQDFTCAVKIRHMKQQTSVHVTKSPEDSAKDLIAQFATCGFSARRAGSRFIFEKGKIGWLAAPVTHAGLFILLIGICVTAQGGYRGIVNVNTGESMDFPLQDKKPLIGKLPKWRLTLNDARKEDHPTGKVRQWYSTVSVNDFQGKPIGSGTVSVNTPITVGGIDIYQSDWELKAIKLRIDGKDLQLPVQPMGSQFMGILQIMPEFMLIGVVPSANAPMHLFFKHDGHPSPKLVATLGLNETFKLGDVRITNAGTVVTSGLQYKYDPGLPIVYVSFLFLTVGAYLVATPSHRIFAEIVEDEDNHSDIVLGSDQTKFAGLIKRELRKVETALRQPNPAEVVLNER